MRLTLLAAALAGLLLLGGDHVGRRDATTAPRVRLVDGSLSIANSLQGRAIFTADDIGPGHSTSGTVSVQNTGSLWGTLTLSQTDLSDTPGPGGGPLSQRLDLVVNDLSSGSPMPVYTGKLDGLDALPLGLLGPGRTRVYGLTASLPDGTGDDAFSGSAMSAGYVWTLDEATAPPEPPGSAPEPPRPGQPEQRRRHATPRPRLRLRVPPVQRRLSRGRFVAYLRCDRPCTLVARVSVPAAHGRGTAARRARASTRNRTLRLVFRLPRVARRAIARHVRARGRCSLKLSVAARSGASSPTHLNARVRLRRVRSRDGGYRAAVD